MQLKFVVPVLAGLAFAGSALAQDAPCSAGGKSYDSGTTVCLAGFEQLCSNGNWVSQHRFCADDSRFEVIKEPDVAVPQVGGPGQPGVPPAEQQPDVAVPQP